MEDCEDLASTRRAVVKLCCSQRHSKGPAFTLKSARRVFVLGFFWCSTVYLFVTNFILHLGVIGALIVDFTATVSNLQIPPAKQSQKFSHFSLATAVFEAFKPD